MKDSVVYSTVGWRKYLDFKQHSESTYLIENGYEVFSKVSKLIYRAWKNNLESVPVLRLKNSKILAVITDDDYYDALEIARLWFERGEFYEECAWIRDIQTSMK